MENRQVSLGCGTLILIAIIVLIFGNGSDTSRLENQIRQLEDKIDALKQSIDEHSREIDRLRQDVLPGAQEGDPRPRD